MPDLNDVRVFERVAALGSFTAAARALQLPRSTVSRSVARLEAHLGLRLLQRTTRDVALTAAGVALKDRVGPMMDDLDRALEQVRALSEVPRGRLKISCGIAFGINVVANGLSEFLAQYPEVVKATYHSLESSGIVTYLASVTEQLSDYLDEEEGEVEMTPSLGALLEATRIAHTSVARYVQVCTRDPGHSAK